MYLMNDKGDAPEAQRINAVCCQLLNGACVLAGRAQHRRRRAHEDTQLHMRKWRNLFVQISFVSKSLFFVLVIPIN